MKKFKLVAGQENCMNALGEYYENAIVIQWKETVTSNTVWFQLFEVLIMEYPWCDACKLWFSRGQNDSYILAYIYKIYFNIKGSNVVHNIKL